MAKLKEILKNRNYPIIEIREKTTDATGRTHDLLTGYCSYMNGRIVSLDGGTYSLDDEYGLFTEWDDEDEGRCLSIWTNSDEN